MIPAIEQLLKSFEAIHLHEMNDAALMTRIDSKFQFRLEELPQVLQQVAGNYRVLEILNKRVLSYKTLYYDTPDLQLYRRHHNGVMTRYKIRHRTYVESQIGFLELKRKNNKGVTVKDRIPSQPHQTHWSDEEGHELAGGSIDLLPELMPRIWINYNRITLVNKQNPERVTLDLEMQVINGDCERTFDTLVIAEIKRFGKMESPFIALMNKYRFKESGMSKYCLGIATTEPGVKLNNFKPGLLQLQKLENRSPIIH